MIKNKLLQQGFSPLIVILIVATVAIIGLVTWRVYDATTQANMSLDNAKEVSDNQQIPQTPEGDKQTKKIVIPGVEYEIVPTEKLKRLVFSRSDNGHGVDVRMTVEELEALDPDCSASESPLGIISRYKGNYETDPIPIDQRASWGVLVKQEPDYYISYIAPQAACSEDAKVNQLQEESRKDLVRALGLN